MQESLICKSTDHLFLPILEVHDPLLRCVHCNVFAYQETVQQLAKKKAYGTDKLACVEVETVPYLTKWWPLLQKACSTFLWRRCPTSRPRAAD